MATENTAPATAPKAKTKIAAPKKAPRTKGAAKDRAATKRTRKPAEPKAKAKGPTRKEQIIEMLRSPGGTTIDAMTARFNILPHTARACISVFGREIGGVSYDRKTKVYRTVA